MSRSTPSKIDPEMLSELNFETQFVSSISTNRRQVKIEKGRQWRLRILPAKLGPKKTFFARIAKHWLATKPIICPRQTGPSFGGDPEAYCPVCDLSAQLNESTNQAESDLGYDIKSSAQWLMYAMVFEKDGEEQPMSEVLLPYEFWVYKSTWEEVKAFFAAGGHKSPLSVLDYKLGNDFIVSRTTKGMKLDKQDSMPIFDPSEAKYAEWIKKVEEGIHQPKVKMPTDEEMETFKIKIEDAWGKLSKGSSARRGQSAGLEEDDSDVEAVDEPETPRRAAAPARATRPAPAPAPAEDDDDQIAGAEMPPKTAPARPAPVAKNVAAPTARPAAHPAAKPAPEPDPIPDDQEIAEEAPAEPALPEEETEEVAPAPAPVRRPVAKPAVAKPAVARQAPPQPKEEAEDDELPLDETTDQAPPAPLEGEGEEAPAPAAPPPVSRRGALGASIASKIQNVKDRNR